MCSVRPLSPCVCGGERIILLYKHIIVVACKRCPQKVRPPKEAQRKAVK